MTNEKELENKDLEQVNAGRRPATQRGGTQQRPGGTRSDQDTAEKHAQAQDFDGSLQKGGARGSKYKA